MKMPFRLRYPRLVIALVCLLGLTACDLYPDSGKWSGELAVHNADWSERYSCSVDIDVTHADEFVSLNSVDSYCGDRSLHWSPGTLDLNGTGLWLGGDEVGYSGPDGTTSFDLADPYYREGYPNRVDHVAISWSRVGPDLQFTLTEYYEGNVLTMEGTMRRK